MIASSPFGDPLGDSGAWTRSAAGSPPFPMDVYRTDEHWVVHAELAGVDPGSIEITLSEDGLLTIGAHRTGRDDSQLRWTAQERPVGGLSRRVRLGSGLDPDSVAATHSDGVLTVSVPLPRTGRRRRVPVRRADPPR